MNNDPELNGKYLGTISSDFVKVADNLKEASYQIRRRHISNYPIFAVSKIRHSVGEVIIEANSNGIFEDVVNNYSICFAEMLLERGLIKEGEGWDYFVANYKDPEEYCCLFIIDGDFTNLVFIPYPED